MEYKDYVHEELENGKVRLMANICLDIEISKEECEKLLGGKNPSEIGNLIKGWIEKGYAKPTAYGDSYLVDKDGDLGDREYFDLNMGFEKESEKSERNLSLVNRLKNAGRRVAKGSVNGTERHVDMEH